MLELAQNEKNRKYATDSLDYYLVAQAVLGRHRHTERLRILPVEQFTPELQATINKDAIDCWLFLFI